MASSKEEWQKYQDALRRGDREAAAEAFRRYQEARRREGKGGSKPTLVSLKPRKTYPHAIPLEQIPDELERNPEFFELMKRMVTKEKT
ncbi:unnamed protein product [marine sediment metagenome]|uniref:Uncharacterized protein n=1 Tax=marine sediment metagenome TaxID=412755 RepID=X1UXB0_9ZZZZ